MKNAGFTEFKLNCEIFFAPYDPVIPGKGTKIYFQFGSLSPSRTNKRLWFTFFNHFVASNFDDLRKLNTDYLNPAFPHNLWLKQT